MHVRFPTALCLVFASVAAMSCTDQPLTGPSTTPSFAKGGNNTPDCDTKKQDCTLLGRMTGGGGTIVVGDVQITKGLTVHCDILLSNNLEINWPDNHWHLDKPITSAECIDDPDISPEPPPAPFDTFIGQAVGMLNGVDGSQIEFTFVDSGEPGGHNDQVALTIYAPGGGAVLNVPLMFLDHGNLQAHYDQPHK